MHRFLTHNREELIARCKARVAARPSRAASTEQLANGVPMFLEQLTRTLRAEERGDVGEGLRISGSASGDSAALSEIGVTAAAHGKALLELGFSVDQVVHDYGDLCQSISDLAVERDAPFSVKQFRTLNRCLDNAIADAVSEFSLRHDASVTLRQSAGENERLGALVHELRNSLQTATLAFTALESGQLAIGGSTGGVLKRSLAAMAALLDRSLVEVRDAAATQAQSEVFSLAALVADARAAASLEAEKRGCSFFVSPIDSRLGTCGNRDRLLAALVNLLQNAFKFTHLHSEVALHAYVAGDRVLIDVSDHCGGLAPGSIDQMFRPFAQGNDDKSGLGLGLSISRQSVEASGGTLTVRDVPGTGCVFTMNLPCRAQDELQKPLRHS
jgi:signal transduction histidine kinase